MIDNPQLVYNVLLKKCSYKKIDMPTFLHIQKHEKLDELEPQWNHMLAHQLTHLPPFESFWADLAPFFDWMKGQLSEKKLVSVSSRDETIFQPGRIANAYSINSVLHKIQFAAANRVCIKLRYNGKNRTIEPLSLRTAKTGNRLFYGFERETGHPKAFSLSGIQSVEITKLAYFEKYPVEITSTGSTSMPPIKRKLSNISSTLLSQGRNRSLTGSKYKFQCPVCEKYFYRKKRNSRLNPHKSKDGWQCSGRTGIFMDYS
jgi:hypothetical protein